MIGLTKNVGINREHKRWLGLLLRLQIYMIPRKKKIKKKDQKIYDCEIK